jgi:hypothetical protein
LLSAIRRPHKIMKAQKERPGTGFSGDGTFIQGSGARPTNPESNIASLRAQHRAWGLPTKAQIGWLLYHGVSVETLETELIAATTVCFNGRFFVPDPDGEKALILRATDRDEVIDLIAWSPHTDHVGSFRGLAFCLGDQDQLFNPASWFAGGGLHVHASPPDWLKADRSGIVIVDPNQTYAMLRHVPRLVFTDAKLARQVKEWVQPPRSRCELLIARSAACAKSLFVWTIFESTNPGLRSSMRSTHSSVASLPIRQNMRMSRTRYG